MAANSLLRLEKRPPRISGVAIAANTDQTGDNVCSWIADIAIVHRTPHWRPDASASSDGDSR